MWPCCASKRRRLDLELLHGAGRRHERDAPAVGHVRRAVERELVAGPGPPSAVKSDVPPLSNGRENFRSPWYATPGARRASTNGLPSESGISAMRFSSITCPAEPLRVSSSGDVGRDRDGLLEVADLERQRELEAIADAHLDALARRLLEAGQLDGHLVGAGGEVGERVSAVAVGGRRGHDVGRDVVDRDGGARKPAALRIGDAPGDGAPEILCVSS